MENFQLDMVEPVAIWGMCLLTFVFALRRVIAPVPEEIQVERTTHAPHSNL